MTSQTLIEPPCPPLKNPLAILLKQTVTDNPYIPQLTDEHGVPSFPSKPQIVFLTAPVREILYGGQAGGGKSAGLLASALQYVQYPVYHAIILRRSFTELEKPGALIPLSHEWLGETDAKYDAQQHRWTFPSRSTLSFGYCENMAQLVREYKSSAFGFFGFDELTEWPFEMYRYLFSRNRKPAGAKYPVRTRAASNPGSVGHEWVRDRFVKGGDGIKRLFIPASLDDNPGLDRVEYRNSLELLDPLTRAQLGAGDWEIRPEGTMFKREWFAGKYIDASELPSGLRRMRYWDLAATKQDAKKAKDPDWCCGCDIRADGYNNVYVCGMERFRDTPMATQSRVTQVAQLDGTDVPIRIEQEPGASAKLYIATFAQMVLPAYSVAGFPTNGQDKPTRAKPFSAACERGSVYIVRGNYVSSFLDELCAFPAVAHDDQVDAVTGGYNALFAEPELILIGGSVGGAYG